MHSPIFAKFIRSKMRTWKSLIVQASPWCVDPCSCGLDLQELQKKFCPWTKGGTSVKSFFHCGPPCDSTKFENVCSSWRFRPLEHESTHHGSLDNEAFSCSHLWPYKLCQNRVVLGGVCSHSQERFSFISILIICGYDMMAWEMRYHVKERFVK